MGYALEKEGAAIKICLGAYTYGFNGKEKDQSFGGTVYDYGFRIYNPGIGKFLSVDPLTSSYPWYTPYQFAGNKPIESIDLDGLEEYHYTLTLSDGGTVLELLNVDESKPFSYVVDYTDKLNGGFGTNGSYQFTENGNLSGFGINRRKTNNTTDNFYNTYVAWEGNPEKFSHKMPRRFESDLAARINTLADNFSIAMTVKSGPSLGEMRYSVVNSVIEKIGKDYIKSTEINFDYAIINGAFRSQDNALKYLESQQGNFQDAKVIETESGGESLYRISLYQTNDRYEAEALRTTSREVEGAEESWILTTVNDETK